LEAFSALVSGHRADYLRAGEIELLDGRGHETQVGDFTAELLRVRFPDGRVLAERPDGTLSYEP
jgi:hypothetical protein